MSESSTHTVMATPPTARSASSVVMRVLAVGTLSLVVLQFALAAYGAFGGGYGAHGVLGRVVPAAGGLLLITAIVGRYSARVIVLACLLVVFAGPSAFLLAGSAWSNPVFGALHGLNGVCVAVLAVMMSRAGRTAGKQ